MNTVRVARLAAFASVFSLAWLTGCPQVLSLAPAQPAQETERPSQTAINRSLNNTPPVADAGDTQTATAGDRVVLDGTGSADANGDALIFLWRQIDDDAPVELRGSFSAVPVFDVPTDVTESATLTFELLVSDGFSFALDETTVTIEAAAP